MLLTTKVKFRFQTNTNMNKNAIKGVVKARQKLQTKDVAKKIFYLNI